MRQHLHRPSPGRPEGRRLAIFAAILAGLPLGACSISLPVSSLMPEEPKATNGVAVTPTSVLARELGPEDWRRAQGALAKALDPHGASTRVAWANPKSALRGSFAPAGQPFVKSDEICRAFEATIDGQSVAQRVEGTACRPSGGDWSIKAVKPASRRA